MNKNTHNFSSGQGLVEYVILIALVGLFSIIGLTLFGGSVEGGLLKVCAAFGNSACVSAREETIIKATSTPELVVTPTPSLAPPATPTLTEPDPTRSPESGVILDNGETEVELINMRVRVVLKGKDNKKAYDGIQVVIFNEQGEYVTKGIVDEKGNISFSLPAGNYYIATLYNGVWQKDGLITLKNSKENIINR